MERFVNNYYPFNTIVLIYLYFINTSESIRYFYVHDTPERTRQSWGRNSYLWENKTFECIPLVTNVSPLCHPPPRGNSKHKGTTGRAVFAQGDRFSKLQISTTSGTRLPVILGHSQKFEAR